MARPDYFERALQAARHVLGNLDQEAFLRKVDGHKLGIAFDSCVAKSEGSATVDLLVRLTARFYPEIAVVALDNNSKANVRQIVALAKQINPNISIKTKLDDVQDVLVVGTTKIPAVEGRKVLYVGSNGWIASISESKPVGSGITGNPLGAGAAACIAAANVFRSLFTQAPRDSYVSLSLLDLDPAAEQPGNPSVEGLNFGQVFLVGAGAIGNGFLWALSRSVVTGQLAVVDHDKVDLGNMQRYVLSVRSDEGRRKTEIAQDIFQNHHGILICPVPHRWEDLMDGLHDDQWKFERVVVALDSPEDRISVQASLPRWIVNGWTQGGEVGVSRHDFLGDQACMACLYVPRQEVPHEDQLIAEALGFPSHQHRMVREMIETGQGLDVAILNQISIAKNVAPEKLLPFVGQSIRSLYTKAVCSGAVFELANGPTVAQAEVPMPFQSALAGILQAASLFAHASQLLQTPTVTQIDLMRPFPNSRLFSRQERKAVGWCFCDDPIYRDVYREKYAISPELADQQ